MNVSHVISHPLILSAPRFASHPAPTHLRKNHCCFLLKIQLQCSMVYVRLLFVAMSAGPVCTRVTERGHSAQRLEEDKWWPHHTAHLIPPFGPKSARRQFSSLLVALIDLSLRGTWTLYVLADLEREGQGSWGLSPRWSPGSGLSRARNNGPVGGMALMGRVLCGPISCDSLIKPRK